MKHFLKQLLAVVILAMASVLGGLAIGVVVGIVIFRL